MRRFRCVVLFFAATFAAAQSTLPSGTVLPVMLLHTVNAKHARPGLPVRARLEQDVRFPGGKLQEGATLDGEVVSVSPDAKQLGLRFDRIVAHGHTVLVTTALRALASFTDIEEALIPPMGTDRMTPYQDATLVLIGGDVSYRGGGPVIHQGLEVGKPDGDGVVVRLLPNPERGCASAYDSQSTRQSLWVFSANACGIYGLAHLQVARRGLQSESGFFSISSQDGPVSLHSGDGLLLTVIAPSQ